MVSSEIKNKISNYKAVSERLLKVEFDDWIEESENKITLIIAYGPNEDDKADNKDNFWNMLVNITESSKGKIFILGDLNGRVGKRDSTYKEVVGQYGEETRNSNGKRILEFCQIQDFIVTNTFFQHKEANRYTREVVSRNERSIIDYVLTQRENRKRIKDVKVNKEAEIYSDHYLVVAKMKAQNQTNTLTTAERYKPTPSGKVNIKTYKLRDTKIQDIYKDCVTREINTHNIESKDLETAWITFKNTILKAAEQACGTTKINNSKKQTAWWNQDIQLEIKVKKQMWKNYLKNKDTNTYSMCIKNNERR